MILIKKHLNVASQNKQNLLVPSSHKKFNHPISETKGLSKYCILSHACKQKILTKQLE